MKVYPRFVTMALCLVASLGATADEPATAAMQPVNMEAALENEDEAVELSEARAPIQVDLVLNVIPAALLINMDGKNYAPFEGAPSGSSVYMMPNLSVGAGVEVADAFYLDGTVGAGVLVNDAFRAFFAQAALAGTYAVTESFNIGPRIGLIHFLESDWLGDTGARDVEFGSDTGFFVGLQLALGDRVRYLVQVDFLSADFDGESDTALDNPSLSLDALAVQFGVRGEF